MWNGNIAGWGGVAPLGGTWVSNIPTVISTGAPDDNGAFMRLTAATDATGSGGGFSFGSPAANTLAAAATAAYSCRVMVRASASFNAYMLIRWYNSSGVQVGDNSAIANGVITANGWTEFKVTNVTAPAGTARAFVTVYNNGPTYTWLTGATMDIAGCLFENAGAVLPYFNGSYPVDAATGWTYSWTGTVGASPSYFNAPARSSGNIASYGSNKGGQVPGGAYRIIQIGAAVSLWAFTSNTEVVANAGDYFTSRWQVRLVSGSAVPVTVSGRNGYYSGVFLGNGSTPGTWTLPVDGSWVDIALPATIAAPAGSVSMRLMLYAGMATAPGTTIELRRCLAEKVPAATAVVGAYFDGASAADGDYTYSWSGTVDSSPSMASP